MLNNGPTLDNLTEEIKGTTEFLARLISRKSGFLFLFLVVTAIVLKLAIS